MLLKLFLIFAVACVAADDPWAKVKDLKSGAELRVTKKGSAQPVLTKFGDLTDESLIVIDKDTQKAIPRDEITMIEARPQKQRVKRESKVEETIDRSTARPSQSSSGGVSIEGKAPFETVYKRK